MAVRPVRVHPGADPRVREGSYRRRGRIGVVSGRVPGGVMRRRSVTSASRVLAALAVVVVSVLVVGVVSPMSVAGASPGNANVYLGKTVTGASLTPKLTASL